MIEKSEGYYAKVKDVIDNDSLGLLYTDQEIRAMSSIALILKKNGVDVREDDIYIILDFFDEKVHDYRTRMKVSVKEAKADGSILRGKFDLLRTGQQIAEYYYTIDERKYEIIPMHKSRTERELLEKWGEDMGRDLGTYFDHFHAA